MRKLDFGPTYDNAQVMLMNYQYEYSYNHVLTKLIALIPLVPTTLKLLIVALPPDATYLDTTLAEHFQMSMKAKHQAECLVLFVRHLDKVDLL